ncbi:MAG: hypothetical protein ABI779_27105 [Acidobacteriota bacterium]
MKRFGAALILVATVAILYRKAIRLWWMYDDAWLLHVALARRWTMTFTDGDTWHRTFTPLLDSTYEVMIALAGLEPGRWHAVSLMLVLLCALSLFFALSLYLRVLPALAGAFLFVAGAPLCTFAMQFMLVHILEAILLGTLATATFILASRKASNALNFLSATLFLLAMLAREIAMPLPALLLVLPERNWRVRARHLVFHAAALVIYGVWRRTVLGTFFSGSGWAMTLSDVPAMLATLPWKVVTSWSGAALEAGLPALVLIGIAAVFALRDPIAGRVALLGLAMAIAPLLTASKEVGPRLTITPWLWLCVVFAFGMSRMPRLPAAALALVTAGALLVANRQQWSADFTQAERMSDEARAFMRLDGASMLRAPAVPPAAMVELQWLKEEHFRLARGSGWFYDDLYLCESGTEGRRVFEYHEARREVLEVTARIPDFARTYCSSIRETAPLRAEFRHVRDSLFWRFGPYANGRWRVVLGGGLQAFDVPRDDGFSLPGVPGLSLRVRYQSPEGWVTYSPDITLDFATQPNFVWHR